MSLISPPFDPDLPRAWTTITGELCTCQCHRTHGVFHCIPCCGPTRESDLAIIDMLTDKDKVRFTVDDPSNGNAAASITNIEFKENGAVTCMVRIESTGGTKVSISDLEPGTTYGYKAEATKKSDGTIENVQLISVSKVSP